MNAKCALTQKRSLQPHSFPLKANRPVAKSLKKRKLNGREVSQSGEKSMAWMNDRESYRMRAKRGEWTEKYDHSHLLAYLFTCFGRRRYLENDAENNNRQAAQQLHHWETTTTTIKTKAPQLNNRLFWQMPRLINNFTNCSQIYAKSTTFFRAAGIEFNRRLPNSRMHILWSTIMENGSAVLHALWPNISAKQLPDWNFALKKL